MSMRATLRRLTVVAALTAAVSGLLTVVGSPEPAHAYAFEDYRWEGSTVCVIDRTSSRWPVDSATVRLSEVPDLTYRYGGTCSQRVYVQEGWYGRTGWYGWTDCWMYSRGTTGAYKWLGNAWKTYWCTVKLNNTYLPPNWDDRRSVIMHELGHTAGLEHFGGATDALMNVYEWWYFDRPTWDDRRGVEVRYPW